MCFFGGYRGYMEKRSKNSEESTKYGEFISSYFNWIVPEKQNEKARELQNITNTKKKNNKNN